MKSPKTRNSGEWTEARFNSFVKSALRGARWGPKYECIKDAFVEHGINPKTGRKCKLHRCASCGGLFTQTEMKADHIDPVIGPEGFVSWDLFIERLYKEKEAFQAVCAPCHAVKTKEENAQRRALKKEQELNAPVIIREYPAPAPKPRKVFAP